MSMYNILFGENPAADIFLELLGFSRNSFFRYRDCYLVEEDGKKVIAVYTRGGGCNRVANDTNFSEHPNFLRDADDEFDNTSAHISSACRRRALR